MINIDERNKTANGVKLRPTEYLLLKYFTDHPNKLLSRTDIINDVWGQNAKVKKYVVDVHLFQLRKKIGNLNIHNRSGFGFIYEP